MSHLQGAKQVSANTAGDKVVMTVTPAATGAQLVRVSVPLPRGKVREGQTLVASDGREEIVAALRALTWHPLAGKGTKSVRRALVTFPYTFKRKEPVRFTLKPVTSSAKPTTRFPATLKVDGEIVTVAYREGPSLKAHLLAPPRTSSEKPRTETVESNAYFLWQRIYLPDPQWSCVIEVRVDVLGDVAIIAHLQRNLPGNGRAPDFGWEVETRSSPSHLREGSKETTITQETTSHAFADGTPCTFLFEGDRYCIYHPAAPFKRRGRVEVRQDETRGLVYSYWRCTGAEKVPMQEVAWRRAELVIAPAKLAPLTPTLQSPHEVHFDWRLWDELYDTGPPLDLKSQPELAALLRYHRDAILRSMAHGDDWGNLTGYSDDIKRGGIFGMNRLNHCPPIFEEAYRSGNRRLLEVALLWCDNFYDQTIWWGPEQRGGTRYNNLLAMGGTPPENDRSYMWRSNSAVNFCTKGYDSFFLAYEETGDPRMREALEAQVRYATQHVHADRGECRNIGDVRDFVRLYRFTGQRSYLEEALRLFRELRTKLSAGDLFSQSGHPILPDPPFIDDDEKGSQNPFPKPYIIGYALAGLPGLARYAPKEPKLREVIQAVADFLAESQDPLGGWRYPHPRSSYIILSQAMEHAWQLVQVDRLLGVQEKHLDAIERVLRQRVLGWKRTGKVFGGLGGWEIASGKVKQRSELYDLYQHPGDRDFQRDYLEGQPEFGSSPPEGLVYFPEVLAFYLKHRPASRLMAPAKEEEPLGKVLSRVAEGGQMILVAKNPDPKHLPTLGVWEDESFPNRRLTMVSATFPNVPDFTCDSWCYESEVDFIGARALDGGKLELRHRLREHPHVILVTTVTPEPGAVEFVARVELEKEGAGELPKYLLVPNLCWQLRRAPAFASAPELYPEFIKRCFIFTDKGRTFLDKTIRRKIPVRSADDPYNNPPWVQMYVGTWQQIPQAGPDSWADYSPDRYTTTVIGAVSRDGKYLTALANDSAPLMAQAWHDCMHNNPQWQPADAPPAKRTWRLKIYAMENDPEALLARVGRDFPAALRYTFQTVGVRNNLPVFRDQLAARLTFPLSWLSGKYKNFNAWRKAARAKVMQCLLAPPPTASFDPMVIAEQDRGTYVARKVVFNLTADSRVLGLMLVPKRKGPFPAVLLLHDHGARFDIGKEKVIQSWDDRPERLESARQWVTQYYGGRFIGDELAKRGYVCFATDALNWSDRGGARYEEQQALASNLLHLGMSLAGLIAHEDMRAAEFLATRPEVDSRRVAAMGLSMGAFRAWQVAALSDRIAGGVAICWMATVKGLMVAGNNQTLGQSSYTMTHPNLFNYLDYPDVASLACPKPMLFYNGTQDTLFPVPAVQDAYEKMHKVWSSQKAGHLLETKLWNVPHLFDRQMQEEAFEWLDHHLKRKSGVSAVGKNQDG